MFADGIDSQKDFFIHFWNATIVLKTSIRFHCNINSIAMFPFSSLSIKKRPLCKRIKEVSDWSFQKKNAKGLDDLQNLPMVIKHHWFHWSKFLIQYGNFNWCFTCKRILAETNFSSSLTQQWRRESLSRFKELTLAPNEISISYSDTI